ncbi:hypothetical protein F5Y12DRAFT_531094 [Xylaria sp. FL1777]|nr:hypothetical protein F5Y12DRAFT_531094 [Xylaria sp. FL1777]
MERGRDECGNRLLQTLNQHDSQSNVVVTCRLQMRQLRYAILRTADTVRNGTQSIIFPRSDTALGNAWSANLILLQVHDYISVMISNSPITNFHSTLLFSSQLLSVSKRLGLMRLQEYSTRY